MLEEKQGDTVVLQVAQKEGCKLNSLLSMWRLHVLAVGSHHVLNISLLPPVLLDLRCLQVHQAHRNLLHLLDLKVLEGIYQALQDLLVLQVVWVLQAL